MPEKKQKVIVHFNDFSFGVQKECTKEIECYYWQNNEHYYTFFLDHYDNKVISIPRENVWYVEDILEEEE